MVCHPEMVHVKLEGVILPVRIQRGPKKPSGSTAQTVLMPAIKQMLPARAVADAMAGAISGATARFLIGPLDVLKIRFQVGPRPDEQRFSCTEDC